MDSHLLTTWNDGFCELTWFVVVGVDDIEIASSGKSAIVSRARARRIAASLIRHADRHEWS